MQAQRGSGALVMVIIILLMGTLLLNATRRQLSDNLSLVADERHYIQQFSQAVSALAWGERLSWIATKQWQCQQSQTWPWRACLQYSEHGWLLRGDSGDGTLVLYRWVNFFVGGKLQALPHGWLDFCPLQARRGCEAETQKTNGI